MKFLIEDSLETFIPEGITIAMGYQDVDNWVKYCQFPQH